MKRAAALLVREITQDMKIYFERERERGERVLGWA
jgi:hypothetical protein